MDEAHHAANAAQVSVRHGLGNSRRPIAVVHVSGEHDFTSRGLLWAALEPLDGDVVVDLTRGTFIDISVIGAILGKALDLGKDGYRLELVVPPSAPFARTIDRLHVGMLLPVLEQSPTITSTCSPGAQEP